MTTHRRWTLDVRAANAEGTFTLELTGRLTAADAPRAAEALAAAIAAGERRITLAIAGLDYISSAGIAVLQAADERLRSQGGELVLGDMQPAVRAALELAGFR
jgi:anti-anti-sigma factor